MNQEQRIRILEEAIEKVINDEPTCSPRVKYILFKALKGELERDPKWCYFCDRPKDDCACSVEEVPRCTTHGRPNCVHGPCQREIAARTAADVDPTLPGAERVA